MAYDDCKGVLRHAWYEVPTDRTAHGHRTEFIGTPRWFQCERCNTIRKEVWSSNGELLFRYYQHPRDWKDDRPRDAGGARVSLVERRMAYASRVRSL